MPLYERLLGRTDAGDGVNGKIPVHAFSAIMGEVARGRLTNAQAQAQIDGVSGAPLSPAEGQEALTLLGTITGTATAKLARAKEIDDVLMLGELSAPLYDTPTEVKARLGV